MTLIDADVFLQYLIFSKHIDSLMCKEVKEAIEMSKVDVLNEIRAEISDLKGTFPNEYYLAIIDKYRKEQSDERTNLSSETV